MCRCVNCNNSKSFQIDFVNLSALIPHCTRKTTVSFWSDVDYNVDPFPDTGYYCLDVCMTFRSDKVLWMNRYIAGTLSLSVSCLCDSESVVKHCERFGSYH